MVSDSGMLPQSDVDIVGIWTYRTSKGVSTEGMLSEKINIKKYQNKNSSSQSKPLCFMQKPNNKNTRDWHLPSNTKNTIY